MTQRIAVIGAGLMGADHASIVARELPGLMRWTAPAVYHYVDPDALGETIRRAHDDERGCGVTPTPKRVTEVERADRVSVCDRSTGC